MAVGSSTSQSARALPTLPRNSEQANARLDVHRPMQRRDLPDGLRTVLFFLTWSVSDIPVRYPHGDECFVPFIVDVVITIPGVRRLDSVRKAIGLLADDVASQRIGSACVFSNTTSRGHVSTRGVRIYLHHVIAQFLLTDSMTWVEWVDECVLNVSVGDCADI